MHAAICVIAHAENWATKKDTKTEDKGAKTESGEATTIAALEEELKEMKLKMEAAEVDKVAACRDAAETKQHAAQLGTKIETLLREKVRPDAREVSGGGGRSRHAGRRQGAAAFRERVFGGQAGHAVFSPLLANLRAHISVVEAAVVRESTIQASKGSVERGGSLGVS
eukprot:5836410-Pleurochrysis_carterae.AAC.1